MDISDLLRPLVSGASPPPPIAQIADRARRRHRRRVAGTTVAGVVLLAAVMVGFNRSSSEDGTKVVTAVPPTTEPRFTAPSLPPLPATAPDNRIAISLATPAFGPDVQAAFIYLVNSDGTDLVQLSHGTPSRQVASQPSWSPDRQRLAYIESTPAEAINAGTGNVVIVSADGRTYTSVTSSGADTHPVWAPDGHHLAFARFDNGLPDIFVIADDGSGLRQLTHGGAMSPTWSPDGTAIAYRNLPGGVIDGGHIFIVNGDGTNPRQLTNGPEEGDPAWSPDGTRIAYANTQDYSIYTIHPDGTGPARITTCALPSCTGNTAPAWSPDSSQLVFDLNQGGTRQPYLVSSTGGAAQSLLSDRLENEVCCTAWS